MFSHVMLGINDLVISQKFYDALMGVEMAKVPVALR